MDRVKTAESVLAEIVAEAGEAMDWLAEGIGTEIPVSFIPNPGNIGDAAINLACHGFLKARFSRVEVCGTDQAPAHEIVFIGGGGNLVEPLYAGVSGVLERLGDRHCVRLFPATVYGYAHLIDRWAGRLRIVCREAKSYEFVVRQLGDADIRLGHDAAFMLAPDLRAAYAEKIGELPEQNGILLRTDKERVVAGSGSIDIMAQATDNWCDPAYARRVVQMAAHFLLGFGRVRTDRLHGAILSAILGRETTLLPNSYYKNRAVFERTLSRLGNVRFEEGDHAASTSANDPVAFALENARAG